MSVGAFPVVVFHDVATEKEIAYMQREVRKQVRIYILIPKVHVFLESHKILRNLHLTFVYSTDKSKVEILQNFVVFSGYMNFKVHDV